MTIRSKFTVSDLLCGLGGATEGCHKSDYVNVIQGLNHDQHAIEINQANHPTVDFIIGDLYKKDPSELKKCDIMVAGIECTNHSNAKGGVSRDQDSRAMANEMFRYVTASKCNIMVIENVREFKDWGPCIPKRDKKGVILKIKKGKKKGQPVMVPDPAKKGQYFHKWKYKLMQDYGFENYSERILCAADYGIPTIRKRLFLIFAKKNWAIKWPEPTHSKNPDLLGLKPWVPCSQHIDLDNHGPSIFGRKKKDGSPNPLVPNTLARIAYGIKKSMNDQQFIMKYYGSAGNTSSINDPLHTITTKDRHALITTDHFYVQHYHGSHSSGNINDPIKTIVTKDEKALITLEKMQFVDKYFSGERNVSSLNSPLGTIKTQGNGKLATIQFLQSNFTRKTPTVRSLHDPLRTIATSNQPALVNVELVQFIAKHFGGNHASGIDDPLSTITTIDHNSLVSLHIGKGVYLLDIKMRWLTPRELADCQGFPSDYILQGNQRQQKKGIGNSIPPGFITAIMDALGEANQNKLTHKQK